MDKPEINDWTKEIEKETKVNKSFDKQQKHQTSLSNFTHFKDSK